ncbi:hypothetical protein J2Z44_004302 [Clostridium punense]|uniref:Uncharacterized protein n=1 Tax=Clostridium punense TaxID=1054297 RepID=A0ABS4K9H4_9CLOT|nr:MULTISPECIES: hypothetical protein [Clostridium]EQB85831.1 hypothetical protein M918_17395 [Clostridium sp. BL8]MBP2024433.1 hypothetical protein [Clostridium punense]
MINTDFKISNTLLEKVNRNIYLILELYIETCKGLDYEDILDEIFPFHFVRKNKEKCIEVIEELKEYTTDFYLHELNPVQQYALFHLIEWWLEVTEYEFEEIIDEKELISEEDIYVAENINNIDNYKSILFSDWDFLEEGLAHDLEYYKIYGPAYEELRDINLEDYLELLPDDKKMEFFRTKNKYETYLKLETNIPKHEQLVIKQLYNAIMLRQNDPRRLQSTTETELSDDVSDIAKEKLHENGIIIAREMPSGYSKKNIGECDFYIYTYKDGIYRTIAIGENKEWGNFENQLKQLIGYMTQDVEFGFTILFNKSVQSSTALTKRLEMLKNFYVEVDGNKIFQIVGDILEIKSMNDVLVTKHENPERKGTYFKIYHFIINANSGERKESALQARR